MTVDWKIACVGFVVGSLIGLTGMGGGSVMTPLMIFMLHVHPAVAVGTDLLYSSVTKVVGSIQHIYQKTVDFLAFRWLAYGSVPGALIGATVIGWLLDHYPEHEVNTLVGRLLGVVYILALAAMVWRWLARHRVKPPTSERKPALRWKLASLGFVAGAVVGMTSVGSGSLYIAVLGLLYPISAAKLVGTDILQGMLVTGVGGIAHLAFGNVDLPMVIALLCGSIPGILVGSRMTFRMPEWAVQTAIVMMLGWSCWNLLAK
ncbi:MAG: sulfite exporter TauE/SafE family protein [Alicyclobacillus sp.]|nr:sulfite exporter TauE/SafE family protein [Alicyclobacillus sp.]